MSDMEIIALIALGLLAAFGFGGIWMRRGDRWQRRDEE